VLERERGGEEEREREKERGREREGWWERRERDEIKKERVSVIILIHQDI